MNIVEGNEVLSDLNALAVEHGYKAITTAVVAGVLRKYSPTAPLRWFDDVSY